MDEPCQVLGPAHRKLRHDPKTTPQQALELFGQNAYNVCLDHIIFDIEESGKKRAAKQSPMLTCRMTEKLLDALEQYAAFIERDKSTVVRECITELMAQKAPYLLFKRFQEHIASRNPFDVRVCEKCGRKEDVSFYHIDLNIDNMTNDNLVALCVKCQTRLIEFRKQYKRQESFFEWFFS